MAGRGMIAFLVAIAASACGQGTPSSAENATAVPVPPDAPSPPESPAAAAPSARASQFSPVDDNSCKTLEAFEETGDWVGECPGVAGYTVEWSSSDLRDDLTLIKGSAKTALQLPTLVANGAFNSPGPRIEWRGPAGGQPDVLIVRVHVANSEGISDSGRLAIARLQPTPCLVAIVPPQKAQSERARAIADGKLPDCLKG